MMLHYHGCFRHSIIDCDLYFIESQHECNYQHIYLAVVGLLRSIPYVEIVPADINLSVAELLHLIWSPDFRNFINVIWNRNEEHLTKNFHHLWFQSLHVVNNAPTPPRTFSFKEWFYVKYDPACSSPNSNYTSLNTRTRHRGLLCFGLRCWIYSLFCAMNVSEKLYTLKKMGRWGRSQWGTRSQVRLIVSIFEIVFYKILHSLKNGALCVQRRGCHLWKVFVY